MAGTGPSILSRLSYLGIAKEVTPGTYLAPTAILPVNGSPEVEDVFGELTDESLRNNDSVLQGLYQGVGDSNVGFDMNAYPDLTGILLGAAIGPDTVTPGISTTLSAASLVGATTISVAASIPALSVIQVDTAANVEYAKVTAVSGAGPYTLTLASPLTIAHSSGAAAVSQTTHTFKQTNVEVPSYSITDWNGFNARGFAGCRISELGIKIDPKGICTLAPKFMGFPSAIQSQPAAAFTSAPPLLGWQWAMTNAGGSSTRGLTLDWSIKRETEPIHASTGIQAPEEVFAGALTLEGAYKARYVDDTDLALFLNYMQSPTTALLTQPVSAKQMGASLAITSSVSGYTTGKTSRGDKYVDSDFTIKGVYNATDAGSVSAVLKNFTTAAY